MINKSNKIDNNFFSTKSQAYLQQNSWKKNKQAIPVFFLYSSWQRKKAGKISGIYRTGLKSQ